MNLIILCLHVIQMNHLLPLPKSHGIVRLIILQLLIELCIHLDSLSFTLEVIIKEKQDPSLPTAKVYHTVGWFNP